MVIHIRQSKYKKDRIVPLSPTMAIGLEKYLRAENPHVWMFNGKEPDGRYSVKGLSWVMRENLKKTSIAKSVNLHSLRHSYATHLLEQGVTFVAKDYRDRAQKKPVSLTGEEFLRRFSLHVMPDGYVRIRRFGIYHHSTKLHLDLQFVPDEKSDIEQMAADQNDETASERILRLTGFDLTKCPHCKEGRLIVIRTLPRIRSPTANLPSMLFAKLQ